jgi:hypothetical protein
MVEMFEHIFLYICTDVKCTASVIPIDQRQINIDDTSPNNSEPVLHGPSHNTYVVGYDEAGRNQSFCTMHAP